MNKIIIFSTLLLSFSSLAIANSNEKLKKNIVKREIAREQSKREKEDLNKRLEQLQQHDRYRPEPMGSNKN